MEIKPPTKSRGLAIARRMKKKLETHGIPVVQVFLFGSLAKGKVRQWSDVDIAVIHKSFLNSRMDESFTIHMAREDFDVPMDIVCLHPEDLKNKYSTIASEIKKYGIAV